jgi:hypothetical protein
MLDYWEVPEIKGKKFFRCKKRSASLTVEACAKMWVQSQNRGQNQELERFFVCRGCQIGAMHAGTEAASYSQFYAKPICGRCLRGTMRLVQGHLCVSCYNREAEWRKGKNARGVPPAKHPELHRLFLSMKTGGKVKTLAKPAICRDELVVAALRDEPQQVAFGAILSPPVSRAVQMDLFWLLDHSSTGVMHA